MLLNLTEPINGDVGAPQAWRYQRGETKMTFLHSDLAQVL